MRFKVAILFFLILIVSLLLPQSVSALSPLTDWTISESLPYSMASNTSFSYSSNIYSIGGSAVQGGSLSDVLKTTVNNGALSSWFTVSNYPNRLIWHSSSLNSSNIYILGGFLDNINGLIQNVNTVYKSNIDINGNLSSWQETTPLPQTLALGSSVIIGNKIYFAGGNTTPTYSISGNTNQNIYFAEIDVDGSLGNWTVAGTLPDKLIGFGMLEINGYVYIFGGNGSNGYTDNVSRAKVNSDGSIETNWENLNALPTSIWRFGITKSGDTIIIAGGQIQDGSITNNVYYSTIKQDGTIEPWSLGPQLPYPNCCSPLVSSGNYIYLIGGHDGGNYTDRVLMSQIIDNNTSPTPTPSPLPTIVPTSTPTPLATPTNKPVSKVFLIPGMGASWNIDALMNCKNTNYEGEWTLAPYAKNYYKEILDQLPLHNWETYPLYYDWRQDIKINESKLSELINTNTKDDEKVNLVGHSMGGLIGRNYLEKQHGGKASKFLAVGAPFQGSPYSYPTFVNGEIWDEDIVSRIAKTLLIKRCGIFPSIQNLLPTYNYLKDSKTHQIKNISSMQAKNNYLPTNFTYPFWGVKVATLAGTGIKTIKTIEVVKDAKWPDGKPVDKDYTYQGDGTVTLSSAQLTDALSNQTINQSHSGIISSTEGVSKILEFIGSPGIADPPYVEPKSALVLIGYPGTFWITDKQGKTIQSEQGMISLINPSSSDYQLRIVPQSNSTLFIAAQFLPNGKTLYKEYKFKGMIIEPKIIHFDSEHADEDIIKNTNDYKKPNFPKFWYFFWNFWNKNH